MKRMNLDPIIFVVVVAILSAACSVVSQKNASAADDEAGTFERAARAICQVESSGGKDKRDGDGGKAIGPFQIHRVYWEDGTYFLKVDWPYEDARDMNKARAVVHAYTHHYARHYKYPWTPETIARLHNGGPKGPKWDSTLPYWKKVEQALQEQEK